MTHVKPFQHALSALLDHLESALNDANMWSETPPELEDLKSVAPFCVDTLPFEGWCQWVLLPQLRHMLENPKFDGLPNKSDIATMADFVFSQRNLNHRAARGVVSALADIDTCLNEQLPTRH